jgi:hypothetical protein
LISGPPHIVRTDQRVLDAYLGADIDEEEDPDDHASARRG